MYIIQSYTPPEERMISGMPESPNMQRLA